MQVKRYNITIPKKYTKNNEEKTQWNNVGVLTEFHKDDGTVNRIIEIPAIGLEAQVFEFKEKQDEQAQPEQHQEEVINRDEPEVDLDKEVTEQDISF